MVNVVTTQRRKHCAIISMNVSSIMNVVTTQRRRYCTIIPMKEFCNTNALIVQLGTSCSFDSPGLPNDSAGYPGLVYVVWGITPSVLRFL